MQTNIPSSFYQRQSKNVQPEPKLQDQAKLNNPQVNSLQNNDTNLKCTDQSNGFSNDNIKIKSPMCLINELARSCKVEHKYILEDEKGPAHKKIFTIKLKLGEEEYLGEATSIKKAQHAAASSALQSTAYTSHPRKNKTPSKPQMANKCITPTVELNGLVMKKGQPVTYVIIEKPKQVFYPRLDNQSNFPKQFRYSNNGKQLFTVRLNVGVRQYIGQGSTVKAARNHAAEQALQELASMPQNSQTTVNAVVKTKDEANKSVMMQVHEIIHKRKLNIKFEVLRETGPSHLRIYIVQCSSGDLKAEGEGRSKKAAKNESAKNLLPQLQKLPPLENDRGNEERPKKAMKIRKKKNINKMSSLDPEYGSNINPSSRLLQIQQAKKEPLPVFKFIDAPPPTSDEPSVKESGFTVEVTVGTKCCTGTGASKKAAKRVAAEGMLKLLGYYPTPTVPGKPAIKNSDNQVVKTGESKVSFSTDENQIVKIEAGVKLDKKNISLKQEPLLLASQSKVQSVIGSVASGGSYKTTLLNVCNKFGIKSQFNEMIKRPDANYLTLLSLATEPQLHSHGEGATRQESYEAACSMALQCLKEYGIDYDNLI